MRITRQFPFVTRGEGARLAFASAADRYDADAALKIDPLKMTVVKACLRYISQAALRSEPVVRRRDTDAEYPNHPLTELILNPAPTVPHELFLPRLLRSFIGYGNALYLIEKRSLRDPAALYFLPRGKVKVRKGGWYEVSGGKFAGTYPYDQILHLRYALPDDADDFAMGVSPLDGQALTELAMDAESVLYDATMLKNLGAVGFLITQRAGSKPATPETLRQVQESINTFNGRNRGRAMAAYGDFEITQLKSGLERTGATGIRDAPRAAICGLLGAPPRLAGVNAPGTNVVWGDTVETERLEALEHTVAPLLQSIAAQMTQQLLRRFWDPDNALYLDFVLPDLLMKNAETEDPDPDVEVSEDDDSNEAG